MANNVIRKKSSVNTKLISLVYTLMSKNKRKSTAQTKNRSQVSGSNAKPWKQKGTGRARQGSRKSPIWVGGAVAHGPSTSVNYVSKINKKIKKTVLDHLLKNFKSDSKLIEVDNIMLFKKTKEAAKWIAQYRKNDKTSIIVNGKIDNYKALRNLENINLMTRDNIDFPTIAKSSYIIIETVKEKKAAK